MAVGNPGNKRTNTPEALRRLKLFNEKAAEAKHYSFISKAGAEDAGFTAHIEPMKVSTELRGADDEATAAVVLLLRFFIQPRDLISVDQIAELYQHIDAHPEIAHWVAVNLEEHNAYLDAPSAIITNGVHFTNRMLLDVFVYGNLAHANEDKRRDYVALRSGPLNLFVVTIFQSIVVEVMRFVDYLQAANAETIAMLEARETEDQNGILPDI